MAGRSREMFEAVYVTEAWRDDKGNHGKKELVEGQEETEDDEEEDEQRDIVELPVACELIEGPDLYKANIHKCDDCDRICDSQQHLMSHRLAVHKHKRTKPYHCISCDEQFWVTSELKEHMKQHYGQPSHKCTTCGMRFVRLYTLHEHMRLHQYHPVRQPAKQETGSIPATVEEGPFKCHACEVDFKCKFDLADHITRNHPGPRLRCGMCGREFANALRLAEHMRGVHKQVKPYECSKCDMKFAYKQPWQRHLLKRCGGTDRSAMLAVCKLCCEEFHSMSELDTHMMMNHPGRHAFDCKKIGSRLVLEGSMTAGSTEMKEHADEEGGDIQDDPAPEPVLLLEAGANIAQVLECPFCSIVFPYERSLKAHVRWHERTSMCTKCGILLKREGCPICGLCPGNFEMKSQGIPNPVVWSVHADAPESHDSESDIVILPN